VIQALISGRAGVAILVEDERLLSVDLDQLAAPVARAPRDVRFLLGDVRDLVAVESADLAEIRRRLGEERDGDDALQLTLFMLDAELSDGARDESAGALEELLVREPILRFVEGVLHAHPVPRSADLAGAQSSAKRANAAAVEHMFGTLADAESAIEDVWRAWEALPPSLFRDENERSRTRAAFVRAGLFRAMVSRRRAGQLLKAIVWRAPGLEVIPSYHAVVQAWTSALQTVTLPFVERPEPNNVEQETADQAPAMRGREVLELVRVRQDAIVRAMRVHDLVRARQKIEELVTYQFSVGQPIHVAKSLCTLASEAQRLELYALQAELTDGATQVAPDDVWSWRQRGKSLLNIGSFATALEAYDRALSLGGEAVAKNGRAEVLKALGRFDDALEVYDDTVRKHPESMAAKSGRAEVLKSLGRFQDALEAYEAAIQQHPEDVVIKNGRAGILKSLGRFEDALEAYEAAVRQHPESVVAKSGRAEVLKSLGRFEDALEAYEVAVHQHPESVVAKSGRAEVLKSLGRFEDALEAYEAAIHLHPESVVAKNGRAEVLKSLGRFDDALEAYEAAARQHPEDAVIKNGRAGIFKSLGRFEDALEAYEAAARQHPEDVVAKSGRAEVLKSLGRFDDALQAYDNAVREHPENAIAKTGRACILAAIGKPDEALLSLIERRPITEHEWVGYHVRGMILLRKGNVDEAIAIFQDGQDNNPFLLHRDYFRTALAVARLHKRQYAAAAEVLAQIKLPRFQSQADLLRVHAFGIQNRFEEASAAFNRLPRPSSNLVRELVEELHRRFVDQTPPQHDDDWLLQHEIDSCLLSA
jgi:tetratricopeptide (TPR) repeat protein